jgi:phage tail protein X
LSKQWLGRCATDTYFHFAATMPLSYRYLGLALTLLVGWMGAKVFTQEGPEAESVPAALPNSDRQLVLRKESSDSLTANEPLAHALLEDREFVAQLPNPPAALVSQPVAPAPSLEPHPVPQMPDQYESLVVRQVVHRIIEGDTLPRIATQYLGSPERYREIYEANRDVLQHPEILPIGVELQIPPVSLPKTDSLEVPTPNDRFSGPVADR